jgi:hypothetical protein
MRAVSNSFLAALVVVALFWGNCFSCPQLLLALAQQTPAHACCHHQKTSAPHCETQSLSSFVQAADTHVPAPVPAALAPVPAAAFAPVDVAFDRPAPNPPDLEIQNSSIRI